MNLDPMYIAVFIRQDMFPDHQMVHTFHLGFLAGKSVEGFCQKRHNVTGHPTVLLFGCTNEQDLIKAADELDTNNLEHFPWVDPDSKEGHDDFGLCGIVTQPMTKQQRNKLSKHRPWTDRNNVRPGTQTELRGGQPLETI